MCPLEPMMTLQTRRPEIILPTMKHSGTLAYVLCHFHSDDKANESEMAHGTQQHTNREPQNLLDQSLEEIREIIAKERQCIVMSWLIGIFPMRD